MVSCILRSLFENVQPTQKRQPRVKKPYTVYCNPTKLPWSGLKGGYEDGLWKLPRLLLPTDWFTVAVEGNIGSGKSTCLEYFRKQKEVEVIPEPVFKWKDVKGYNTLEMMYKDASRWSLAFQSYVQLTMADVHRKDTQRPVKMIERSLYSARYCFVENLYQGGLMPEVDYAILSEWYNWIQDNEDMHIDLIDSNSFTHFTHFSKTFKFVAVYLQALPVTCQERIKMRNRHEEQSVPLDYLESLNDLHENWLIKQTKFKTPCPVLVINADCGLDDMYKKFDLHREEILRLNKEN